MVQAWHHAGQVLRVVADVATRSPISESPNQGSLPYLVTPMLPLQSTVDCDVDVQTRPLRRTMDCMNTRPSSLHSLNLLLGYHFTIVLISLPSPRPSQADQNGQLGKMGKWATGQKWEPANGPMGRGGARERLKNTVL